MKTSTSLSDCAFIDVHYHAGPDAFIRRHNVMETGRQYAKVNGWVVLKNHLGCTAAQAWEARQEGFPVSGSVVLNEIAGGIDYRVVQRSLIHHGESEARLLVHLPTVTGRNHQSKLKRQTAHSILKSHPIQPLTVSREGKLTEQTIDILRMSRDYPIVVSTGHANTEEIHMLIEAAVRYGVPKLMLNQPANPLTALDAEALIKLSQAPMIYTEQTALTYLLGYQAWEDFLTVLKSVPRALYSSDLGQLTQPDIEQWLGQSEKWFELMNLSSNRIDFVRRECCYQMLKE